MLSCVHRYIVKYENPSVINCPRKTEDCDSYVLGLLQRNFKKRGIYPMPGNTNFIALSHSVQTLRNLIAQVPQPDFACFEDSSSCCKSPMKCACSGLYCQRCQKKLCTHCSAVYKVAAPINHGTCVPISKLITEVTAIVCKIEGLELSRFVKQTKPGGKSNKNDSGYSIATQKDLWECVEFTI